MNSATQPSTWIATPIGSIANVQSGMGFPHAFQGKTDGAYPVYKVGDVSRAVLNSNGLLFKAENYVSESDLSQLKGYIFDEGSTLFAKIGEAVHLNRRVFLARRGLADNNVMGVKAVLNEMDKYLYYFMRTVNLSDASRSTTVPSIRKGDIEEINIPFPPLAEQKQIAAILDELLAQVDTIKARLDAIPKIIKRFRQSVLAAAVSGRLTGYAGEYQSIEVTEPWAHTVEAPRHWRLYEFAQAVNIIGGSQPPKSEFKSEEGPDLIRLIQIRDYKSDDYKVFIPRHLARRFCSKDDIMIGRYGPPIFQILRGLEGAYNVALMKAEPKDESIDREYLFWFLKNHKLFHYIDAGSDRTAGQSGVNKSFLEKYPFFVPSLDEQTEIVRRVEQLFAFADQIEQRVKDATARVNHLTQSILAKAFRGELTADWRAQNPDLISGEHSAGALLARIRAEREQQQPARRGRRTKS